MTREQYDSVTGIVDAATIIEALRSQYGADLESPRASGDSFANFEEFNIAADPEIVRANHT